MRQHPLTGSLWVLLSISLLFTGCQCSNTTIIPPRIKNGGRAIAVSRHPSKGDQLLVVSETGGIFETLNAGQDWRQITDSTTFWYSDVIYDPSDPDILIATAYKDSRVKSGAGVWRSTNGGSSWKQITLPPSTLARPLGNANCISADPVSKRLWVGTDIGLLYSDDKGANWIYLAAVSGYNNQKVISIQIPVTGHLRILTSSGPKSSQNNGQTWTGSNNGLPGDYRKEAHNMLAVSPINDQHLFLAFYFIHEDTHFHKGIYFSEDNGNNWVRILDIPAQNRPPFIRVARSRSGQNNRIDVYFSDGSTKLMRGTFTDGQTLTQAGDWENLSIDHADCSDLAFKTDGTTPLLLTSDGGVSTTTDGGASWHLTGSGYHGYAALQITEVTGQKQETGDKSDLYFATQDNHIWASPDQGSTWPKSVSGEGFYLNIPRQYLSDKDTRITGVGCGACNNFIGHRLFAGFTGFPNPPETDRFGHPCLVQPHTYIQSTRPDETGDYIFAFSNNDGGSWTSRFHFPETPRDLSKIGPVAGDPVILTAVRLPGSLPGDIERIGIKRTLGALEGFTPFTHTIENFGSLGSFATAFAWYRPFAVDPFDSYHLIVADIEQNNVKYTFNCGISWEVDEDLTALVKQNDQFKFSWDGRTQITNISFDPDQPGHILVGTYQSGIYRSCNNGQNWTKVEHSALIPQVSSFYFTTNHQAVVSSYGRGLWYLSLDKCGEQRGDKQVKDQLNGPLLYHTSAYTPLSLFQPEEVDSTVFIISSGGDIVDYSIDQKSQVLLEVKLSSGSLLSYSPLKKQVSVQVKSVVTGTINGVSIQKNLREFLQQHGYRIKGLYLKGGVLQAVILNKSDLTVADLPDIKKPQIRIFVDWKAYQQEGTAGAIGIRLSVAGLSPSTQVLISIDGVRMSPSKEYRSDAKGGLREIILIPLLPGDHRVLIEQPGKNPPVKEAYFFTIPMRDEG